MASAAGKHDAPKTLDTRDRMIVKPELNLAKIAITAGYQPAIAIFINYICGKALYFSTRADTLTELGLSG
jgi:hypothetical protein